jgi:hypothetical protein
VKSVALWSTNIRKLAKEHKSYGSAANRVYNVTFHLEIRKMKIKDANIFNTVEFCIEKNPMIKSVIYLFTNDNEK